MKNSAIIRFAKHEAGHAVHFIMNFQERFEFVWSRRTKEELCPEIPGRVMEQAEREGRGGGVFFQPNPQLNCTTFAIVSNCMAGVAGERINRKRPGTLAFVDILMGAESDWRQARRHIQESNEKGLSKWIYPDAGKFMNTCLKDAHRQLQALKPAHEAVTRALVERGKLTYNEVKALVWNAMGWKNV